MAHFEASIIIPVYNKWDLTRNCLKSLAATTAQLKTEIIVVDNASTDPTPRAIPFLAPALFGDSFKYIRNDQNRNFAGACNQGAEAAQGKYLVFLNNDTLAEPGWLEPLLADFETIPKLGATGSLLVYPDQTPFGRLVQHLGLLVTPLLKFGHLYQGLPESSSLARKRRFFQAITGACLAMEKDLFLNMGQFDENYKNGFEDVDLCARLVARGLESTVNPASTVVHLEGQSEGRHQGDAHNYDLLSKTNIRHFRPDWHLALKRDNFTLQVDNWGNFQPGLPREREEELNSRLPAAGRDELQILIRDNIYWQKGWEALLNLLTDPQEYLQTFKIYFKFFRNIPNAARARKLGKAHNDRELASVGDAVLHGYKSSPQEIHRNVTAAEEWCRNIDMPEIAGEYQAWLANYENFRNSVYPEYARKYFSQLDQR